MHSKFKTNSLTGVLTLTLWRPAMKYTLVFSVGNKVSIGAEPEN